MLGIETVCHLNQQHSRHWDVVLLVHWFNEYCQSMPGSPTTTLNFLLLRPAAFATTRLSQPWHAIVRATRLTFHLSTPTASVHLSYRHKVLGRGSQQCRTGVQTHRSKFIISSLGDVLYMATPVPVYCIRIMTEVEGQSSSSVQWSSSVVQSSE